MSESLLNAAGAAEFLHLHPSTIRTWTSQGKLPHVKILGKTVRYRIADLERVVTAGHRPGTSRPSRRRPITQRGRGR